MPSPIKGSALALPGRIEAWSRAPIYARVSGYLKRWSRDIGEPVKAGQVLAEIDTPDVDQELQQARAELARARSEAALADTTARRWQSLLTSDSVSRQEVEERVADHTAKHRAEAGAEDHLMDELRKPRLQGRIGPHEQLSEESARALARWILDGAR